MIFSFSHKVPGDDRRSDFGRSAFGGPVGGMQFGGGGFQSNFGGGFGGK